MGILATLHCGRAPSGRNLGANAVAKMPMRNGTERSGCECFQQGEQAPSKVLFLALLKTFSELITPMNFHNGAF